MDLLQMGLSGGLLILLILGLRPLLLHRLPKTAFLALWEIAALRLVLPLSIPLPFSIFPQLSISGGAPKPPAAPLPAYGPAAQGETGLPIFSILWGVGTLVLAALFIRAYVRNMRDFKMSLPDQSPIVETWLTAHGGIRPLEVRVSDRVTSPLTYGLLRPVILLPKGLDHGDRETLEAVLTHEHIHVRRLDNGAKLLFAAALCLHWWDPLVWAMYVLGNRDMELSCDAAAIRALGPEHRSAYALALIAMEERRGGYAPLQSCFSQDLMTERIEAIMKFKRTSAAAAVLAAVLTIGGATAAFAVEAAPKGRDESIKGSELLDVRGKDGAALPRPQGDIPFAPELKNREDCQIQPKSKALEAELPPLDIPEDFREAVRRGEISPMASQEGAVVTVFDAQGNEVPLKLDEVCLGPDGTDEAVYLYMTPTETEIPDLGA